MTNEGVRKFALVFVCHAGELELKALLLAASLRRCFGSERYDIVWALPRNAEPPSAGTLSLLESWGMRRVEIVNEVDSGYALANKVACLGIETDAARILFLDSDILCLRAFPEARFDSAHFHAKPADLQTFTRELGPWRMAYEAAGVSMPEEEFPSTVSLEFGPPYFNSGVVSIDSSIPLAEEWTRCCRAVLANPAIPNKDHWAEQLSLAVAVRSLSLDYDCLDEGYNFPAHLKPLEKDRLPIFCHYHSPGVIQREPVLRDLTQSFAREHPPLRRLIEDSPRWRPVLEPTRFKSSSPDPDAADLIITGISRSGTSYLCQLLHQYSNCVIVNEPEEVLEILPREELPWSIPLLYRQLRTDVLFGRPLRNKLRDGEIISDTFEDDRRSEYIPSVENADFILGTKNTMSYLARLEALRRVMPKARVVVCVRDPFDTIASWKSTFAHLAAADLRQIPVGHPDDAWLGARHRLEVEHIINTPSPTWRRARWWRFAAERILEQGDSIILVRYHDLVARPDEVISQIFEGCDAGQLRKALPQSTTRSRRGSLGAEDEQAIRATCWQTACDLGLV